MKETVPIILLLGMAADEQLFHSQLAKFPNLRVQPWIEPLRGESLNAYAARMASLVNPGCACIVGGASFGGVVALEMAQHLPAVACILISSIRSPSELPRKWRFLGILLKLGPEFLRRVAWLSVHLGRCCLSAAAIRRLNRLVRPESAFHRWAICALLTWKRSDPFHDVPIFQIHGSADPVLPVSLTRPDVIVPGGEHALPMFSPSVVNDFIADVLRKFAPP